MSDSNQDRGDDIKVDDNLGDTSDLDRKVEDPKEPEAKEPEDKKEEREEKDPKGQITIPKKVFDERVAKAKEREAAALKRAEEAEAKLKTQSGNIDAVKIEQEIDAAEEELEKAIADGNVEKKQALRKLIRSKNQELAEGKAAALAARGTAAAIEQVLYNSVVERMEAEHPELNPDEEATYDQDMVDEIAELKVAFEAAGHASSEALKKALKVVYKGATPPKKEEPKAEEEEDTPEAKAAKLASERAEKARLKGMEDKKRQPVDNKKAGLDSDKAGAKLTAADIAKMTEKEFDALPEADKKKFRGDDM